MWKSLFRFDPSTNYAFLADTSAPQYTLGNVAALGCLTWSDMASVLEVAQSTASEDEAVFAARALARLGERGIRL
jgi:hypothetical protein